MLWISSFLILITEWESHCPWVLVTTDDGAVGAMIEKLGLQVRTELKFSSNPTFSTDSLSELDNLLNRSAPYFPQLQNRKNNTDLPR